MQNIGLFPDWSAQEDCANEEKTDFSNAHKYVFVAFSGGKDSVAAFLAARKQYPDRMIELVFTDTGDETPDTYEYGAWFNENVFPITRLATRMELTKPRTINPVKVSWSLSREDIKEEYWSVFDEIRYRASQRPDAPPFPGNGLRFCTKTLKVLTFNKYVRHKVPVNGRTLCVVVKGLRRQESNQRAKTQHVAIDPDNLWDIWHPIYDYSIRDVFQAHKDAGIKYNPTYEYRSRSNCMGCPFSFDEDVARTVQRYGPEIIEEWVEIEKETGYTWKHGKSIADVTVDGAKGESEIETCLSGMCDL